jgi:hypothetical protein
MLSYFLKIMKQNCGAYVCVQLLQTLNILFENIRNVFRVQDKAMLKFIRDKTAAPYFSNLIVFIGMNVVEIDESLRVVSSERYFMTKVLLPLLLSTLCRLIAITYKKSNWQMTLCLK